MTNYESKLNPNLRDIDEKMLSGPMETFKAEAEEALRFSLKGRGTNTVVREKRRILAVLEAAAQTLADAKVEAALQRMRAKIKIHGVPRISRAYILDTIDAEIAALSQPTARQDDKEER